MLEALPPSGKFTGIEAGGERGAAASDFEVFYHLCRLACADRIDEPEQLLLPDKDA